MKKRLLYGIFVFSIVLLLYGCIASYGKINVVVSINPTEVYEGQLVTITLNTIPNIKLTEFSGGEIILDDKSVISGSDFPLKITKCLSSGTHTIYGKVRTYSEEYKSDPITLDVKPAAEKYKVFLEMEDSEIKSGQTANITVNLNELPDASWNIELYINNELKKTFFSVPSTYNWTPEKSGKYNIYAKLNIMKSQIKSNEYDVRVLDSTPPRIDYITTIPRNKIGESDPVYAFIKFDDEVPVVNIMSVLEDASNPDLAVSEATPMGRFGFIKLSNGLKEGNYKASIWVQNSDGLTSSASVLFTVNKVDRNPPEVFVDVNDNEYIIPPNEDIIIKMEATDDTYLESYKVILDGQNIDEKDSIDYPTLNESTVLRNIQTGYHYLRVIVYDKSGKYTIVTKKFLVTDLIIDLKVETDKERISPDDNVNIYLVTSAASDVDNIDTLLLFIDDATVYSYYSTDTTESTPSFVHKWIADVGLHYITAYIRLKDGKEGLSTKIVKIPDSIPPTIEALMIDDIELATDVSQEISQGIHTIDLVISDNWKLPQTRIIEVDIWKNQAEPSYVTTVPLELDDVSSDSKEATYTASVDLSAGDYMLIPKDIKDYEGNKIYPDKKFLLSVR